MKTFYQYMMMEATPPDHPQEVRKVRREDREALREADHRAEALREADHRAAELEWESLLG